MDNSCDRDTAVAASSGERRSRSGDARNVTSCRLPWPMRRGRGGGREGGRELRRAGRPAPGGRAGLRRFATDWVRRITGTTRYDPDRTAQLASSLDPMARGLAGDLALSGARFWCQNRK